MKTESLSKKTLILINNDFDNIVNQMINDDIVNTRIYSLFENLKYFNIEQIKLIINFLTKNGYNILENKLKQTGLYYNRIDLYTFIDYYTEDIYNYINQK